MSLVTYLKGMVDPIPKPIDKTQPINVGQPVMATTQQTESTGFFGWLDDLGSKVGDVAGRAVDTVADGYINDLAAKNSNAVKTPDVTPTPSDSKLPVKQTFFEANKTYIMWGGVAVLGVTALALAFRK